MIPIGDDAHARPQHTFGTDLLLLVLLGIFVYTELSLETRERGQLQRVLGLVPTRLFDDPLAAWPMLVSHMFLHANLLHVLSNCLFFWVFGRALECELRWFFLPVFLALGVFAGLGSALLRAGSEVPSIGASGAISGVMGAYLVLFPLASVRLLVVAWAPFALIFRSGMPVLDVPAWIFLPLWLGTQVLGGLGDALSPGGVDYGAHLAGFVGGYGLVVLLRRVFGLWPDERQLGLGFDPLRQPMPRNRGAYLAANRPLQAGHVLQAEDLVVMNKPRAYVDPNAVPAHDRRTIVGRTLLVDRYRFEPVLWSDLDSVEPDGPLARSEQGATPSQA